MEKIAVVGATGLVGREFLRAVSEYKLCGHEYALFASERSAGRTVELFSREHTVEALNETSFDRGFSLAYFFCNASVSRRFAPVAVSRGAVAIDNSSAFRMRNDVPLVIPEVNPQALKKHKGIVANPNCSTIQSVMAIAPLHARYGVKRVVYTTYQSVSGAGFLGINRLNTSISAYVKTKSFTDEYSPDESCFECVPRIGDAVNGGSYSEEMKMIGETRKILDDNSIRVFATCVRVPVLRGHCVSIGLELRSPFALDEVKRLLLDGGILLRENMTVGECIGSDNVFVSRLRRDVSVRNGLCMFVAADNLRRGAAGNALKIGRLLLEGV